VQELALIALLAKSPQPMLANQVIEVRIRVCGCVAVGTGRACWTVALQVGFAYWTVGGDAVAVVGEKEGREGEVVLGRAMLKDLAAEIGGTGSFGEDGCHIDLEICCSWWM
jgi:hypothetical protein